MVTNSFKQLYANIGKLISSSLELNKILEGIMEEIHICFNPENWSLLRLDATTDELFFVIFNGPVHLEDVKNIRLKLGEGIAGTVAKNKKPYFVPDTSLEKDFCNKVDRHTGFETRSIIAVPLVCRDKVYGVIEIINPMDGSQYTGEEFLVLQTIADFSAIAFANAALHEHFIELSYTDSLTGTLNRRRFEQIIENKETPEIRNRRNFEKKYVSVIVIDLNNFKHVNDKYGHMAGDDILKAVANFLKKCIREDDMLFRIGGDEFVILFVCITKEQQMDAETRILDLLEKGNGKKLVRDITVKYSFGHASGDWADINQLVVKADENMYATKKEKLQ